MRWLEFDIPNRHYSIPSLELLIRCAAESRWVRVHYRSETRSRWLELLPLRIYTSHGFWYCEAYSPEHQEERTFRVDRMSGFAELEQPATGVTARGAGGATGKGHSGTAARTDATEKWAMAGSGQARAARADQSGAGLMGDRVRIHARLTYRGALLAEQDRHFGHLVRQIGDEEWLLDVMCPVKEWRWAVKFFYSLALDAEVLEPVQLREEIRRMADEVRERYDRDPDTNLEKERRS